MGIEIVNKPKQVRLDTLRHGDLFFYDEKVFMMTDKFFGHYTDFINRLVVCIENGKCFTVGNISGINSCVEPIHNAQLVIGRTF